MEKEEVKHAAIALPAYTREARDRYEKSLDVIEKLPDSVPHGNTMLAVQIAQSDYIIVMLEQLVSQNHLALSMMGEARSAATEVRVEGKLPDPPEFP